MMIFSDYNQDHVKGAKYFGGELLNYLKDPSIGVIKHSGYRGIGRWMIVKHAVDMAMESHLFDVLIWLKLSQEEQRPGNLQKIIAKKLGIEFSTTTTDAEDSEYRVNKDIANSIEAKLTSERFLLVLGDVLEYIDLTRVGVLNTLKTGWKKTSVAVVSKVVFVTTLEDSNFNIQCDQKFSLGHNLPASDFLGIVQEEAAEAAHSLKRSAGSYLPTDTVVDFLLYLFLIDTSSEAVHEPYLLNRLLQYSMAEGYVIESTPIAGVRQERGGGMNKVKATEKQMILSERVMKPLLKELYDRSFIDKNHKLPSYLKDTLKEVPKCWIGNLHKAIGSISLPVTPRWHNLIALFITSSINATYLEELDLPPTFFGNMQGLRVLELRWIPIGSLPSSLTSLSNLRLLLLQSCQKITALPTSLQPLQRLEFLQLSNCRYLQTLPEQTFEQMSNLRHLDLSNSKIRSLPTSASKLRGLQLLVLASCESLVEIPEESFDNMQHLEVLDLSNSSSLESLPSSLSNLVSLRRLFLTSCSSLKTGLGVGACLLKSLSSLEVLDLNSCCVLNDMQDLSFRDLVPHIKYLDLCGLRSKRLSFRGCHGLEHLALGDNENLEVLDLSSTTQLKKFYFKINSSRGGRLPLRRLDMLPDTCCRNNQDPLFQGINWPNNDIGAFTWVTNPDIFENVSEEVFETECFSRFQIRVSSFIEETPNMPMPMGSILGIHFRSMYKQINSYFQNHLFSYYTRTYDRHLEIYKCKTPLKHLQNVLRRAKLLTLFDSSSVDFIADSLQPDQDYGLKECRIGSCQNIKAFCEETQGRQIFGSLEVIWVSDLPRLQCLNIDPIPSESFSCLKHVHLERCPKLVTLFTSCCYLNSLETLEIKFCSRLEFIFHDAIPGEKSLQMLESLRLWELHKLKRICQGYIPKLQKMRVRKLRKLPLLVGGSVVEIEGESDWWNHLQWADHEVEDIKHLVRFQPWRLLPFTSRARR